MINGPVNMTPCEAGRCASPSGLFVVAESYGCLLH